MNKQITIGLCSLYRYSSSIVTVFKAQLPPPNTNGTYEYLLTRFVDPRVLVMGVLNGVLPLRGVDIRVLFQSVLRPGDVAFLLVTTTDSAKPLRNFIIFFMVPVRAV